MRVLFFVGATLVTAACTKHLDVECEEDLNCNLAVGGVCRLVPDTGHQWCSYPDTECPSGYRWSDFGTGDGLADTCVPEGPPDGGPSCSPLVAFTREDGLFVVKPDGTGIQSIATGNHETKPVWSPDGKRVAFIRGRAGMEGEDIWVVNNDGTGLANLTQGIAENDNSPAWSPDGARIAFVSQRGDGTQNDLWVMNSDGSGATMLDVKSVSPMWSPDGAKLAYSSYKSGRLQIWVANADGSNSANVSNSTSPDTDPVWSTDGTMLAFMGTRSAAGPAIYIMNADGSNQQALAASMQNSGSPMWSPDSKQIAFAASPDGDQLDVYRIDANRQNLVNLTMGVADDDQSPTWSADGTQLAIVSHRDGNDEVYRINNDGTGPLRMTMTELAAEAAPRWSTCQ